MRRRSNVDVAVAATRFEIAGVIVPRRATRQCRHMPGSPSVKRVARTLGCLVINLGMMIRAANTN